MWRRILTTFFLLLFLALLSIPRPQRAECVIITAPEDYSKVTLGLSIVQSPTTERNDGTTLWAPVHTLSPPPDPTVDYLIITRRTFSPWLENFVKWKENLGYSVAVLTLEDNIENRYSGRDVPERIRNCIRDYYENLGIRWVLLVGDADPADGPSAGGYPNYMLDNDWEIPIRYVWNPDGAPDDTGQSENWTPTDLYYAGLDGDWDNYLYENLFRFPDWEAEVYVGRWPVRSVDELLSIIDKTINYRAPSRNFLNIGTRLSAGLERMDDEGVIWTKENVRRQAIQRNLMVYPFYDLSPSCYSVSVSRDGGRIGVGTSQSGRFYIFDNSENVPRMTFVAEDEVMAVALAKDENRAIIGTSTGTVFFFDNFLDNTPAWSIKLERTIKSLCLSSDGRVGMILTENALLVFDNLGKNLWTFEDKELTDASLSENGQFTVAVGGNWIRLWQENSIKWIYENSELVDNFTKVSISPSGTIVVGGYKEQDAVVATFRLQDNTLQWQCRKPGKTKFVQASGNYILAALEGGDNLVLYFWENDNLPLWQQILDRPVSQATLSGNGSMIAFSIPYWENKPCEIFILDNTGQLLCDFILENLKGTRTPGKVYALSMPENGEWLAVGALENFFLLSPVEVLWSFDPRVFPPISRGTVLSAINELNPSFLNSYSHGWIQALYYVEGPGLTRFMDTTTESSLINTGFLQVSFACLSAAVDTSTQCLGENLLLARGRGAVAYVGASRPMWVTENAGGVRELDQEFWRIFFTHPSLPYRPGPALYGAISSFAQNYPEYSLTKEEWRNNLLCLILLGDPELRVFPLPRPPLLLSPVAGENLGDNKVRLEWAKTELIEENFRLFLDNRPDFLHPMVVSVLDNFWEGELPEGTWYWRVQAIDASGEGENSETLWFTIDITPPRILWVTVNTDFYSATLSWQTSEPVYGILSVDGRIFSTPLGTRHSVNVQGLSPGTTYTCVITVRDPAGNESSLQYGFTTPRPNSPPVAGFSFSPVCARENENVSFLDRSYDPDGYIVRWHWDFGDGKTSSESNPVHAFENEGRYVVSLTVWDDKGASATVRKTIEIIPLNLPPAAYFSYWPPDPNTRDEVIFDASSSTDPDGVIVSFLWDFGDNSSGEGEVVRHSFALPGTYRVRLKVLDNGGKWSIWEENLAVVEPPPAPSVSELTRLPLENLCWILLRSQPQSSALAFQSLPLWQRVGVVRLAENSLQKMVDLLQFVDPEKAGETLRLTPSQALLLLRLLLQANPRLTAQIVCRGPSQLLENFSILEVLTILKYADNLGPLLSTLSRVKSVVIIDTLVTEGDFETVERIFTSLPQNQLVELWDALSVETRSIILPHLSKRIREKVERGGFPLFVLPLICVILVVLGLVLFRKILRR
jgi:PKD repeat protein